MTYVSTPKEGAFGRKSTRGFGPIVGAVAFVVAAGAAIATGIAISEPDVTTATQSIYLDQLETLKYQNPAVNQTSRAGQVHRGRSPALTNNATSGISRGTFEAGTSAATSSVLGTTSTPAIAELLGRTGAWAAPAAPATSSAPATDELLGRTGAWAAPAAPATSSAPATEELLGRTGDWLTPAAPQPFYESPGQPR